MNARNGDGSEARVDDLRQPVQEILNGGMHGWVSPDLAPEAQEEFWGHIHAWETGPTTTDFQRLGDAGVELPEPELLTDDQVTAKLWEVIEALANLGVFLTHTDHLSDRELYARLWRDQLRHEIPALPPDPASTWHVNMLGSGSEADIELYLTYYADDNERSDWLADFPDYELPAHRELPFDRDRRLLGAATDDSAPA